MLVAICSDFVSLYFQRFFYYFVYILLITMTTDLVLIVILAVFKRVASIYIYEGSNSLISITFY
jgi:hypothetical protein